MVAQEVNVRAQLLQALAQTDDTQRRIAFRRLKHVNRPATLHSVVRGLESGDDGLIAAIASVLPVVGPCPEIHRELVRHLKHNKSPVARRACARELCRIKSPAARQTLMGSLSDPDDGVVIAICEYLGRLGGRDDIEVLKTLLAHSSWQVRLSACATLMEMEVRSPLLVSTLEALAIRPEASAHDAHVAAYSEWIDLRGDIYRQEHRMFSMRSLINQAKAGMKQTASQAA